MYETAELEPVAVLVGPLAASAAATPPPNVTDFSEHYKFTVPKSWSYKGRSIMMHKSGLHSYDLNDFWMECWKNELNVPRWMLCESLAACRQDLAKVFSLHISDQTHTNHDVLVLLLTMPPQVESLASALQEFAALENDGRHKRLLTRTFHMLRDFDDAARTRFLQKKNSSFFASWFACFTLSSDYSSEIDDARANRNDDDYDDDDDDSVKLFH